MQTPAQIAFDAAATDVRHLLGMLSAEIEEFAFEATLEPAHWSSAATMQHWRGKLVELLVECTGTDNESAGRAMVEEALAEHKSQEA